MAKTTSISINLVRSQEKGLLDKILNWALTAGRFLVILTESLALMMFLYRFTLDRQLVDLKDQVKQKAAIVTYLKKNEDMYRNLQQRLQLAKQLNDQAETTTNIVRDLIGFARGNVVFKSFNLSPTTLNIDVSAASTRTLSVFIDKLKTYTKFKSISVDKIETKPSSSIIVVSITAGLKVNPSAPKTITTEP